MFRLAFVLACAIANVAWTTAEGAPLTLKSVVDLALTHDPSVRKEREKLTESESNISNAIAHVLPQVSGQAQYAYRRDSLLSNQVLFNGDPYNQYTLGIQFQQRVYAGGAIWSSYRKALQARDLQALAVDVAERDLVAKAVAAYQGVWSAQVGLRAIERVEAAQREALAQAEKRYKVGLEKRLELLQMQTEMALVSPKLLSARNILRQAASNLVLLLGDEARGTTLELSAGIVVPEDSAVDTWTKQTAEPLELKSLILQGEILDNTRIIELSSHLPSVNVVGNWGIQSLATATLFNRDAAAWNIGLQVNIPIFTGLSSIYERRAFASKISQQQIDEERSRSQLSFQLDQARKELEYSRAVMKASETALKTAREAEAYARETRRQATANYLQVFLALRSALDAETAYEQTKQAYLVSILNYLKAAGLSHQPFIEALAQRQGVSPGL